MKTAPAAVTTYINSFNIAYWADLYTITLIDGSAFRWTTADRDITTGGNTWLANGAVLGRGSTRQTSTLEVDVIDVLMGGTVIVNGATLCLQAINGFFDYARLRIDVLVGSDIINAIANGVVSSWFEGPVSIVVPATQQVRVSVASELETLSIRLPRFSYGPTCQHAVYDPNCTLLKASFTIAGATNATGATTSMTSTTAGIIAKATGYFDLGVVAFTSGALTGTRVAVSTHSLAAGVATFNFGLPLASAPASGVTFNVYPGCHLNKADCGTAKFSNLVNFRGFVHIPKPEAQN